MKKFVVWVSISAGVLICLASVLGLAFWSYSGFAKSSADVGKQYSQWRKNGLPSIAFEVESSRVPAEKNAFVAFQAILDDSGGAGKGVDLPQELSLNRDWDKPAAEKFLVGKTSEMDRIAQAASRPFYQTTRNWDEGIWTLMPELSCYRAWAKMLCADAERLSRNNDVPGAKHRLRTARQLAGHISNEPTLMGYLVAVAVEKITLRSCAVVASAHGDDSQALRSIQKMLLDTSWTEDLARNFRGDSYMMLATMRNISYTQYQEFENLEGEGPKKPKTLRTSGLPKGLVEKAVLAEHLRFWNEFYPLIAAGDRSRMLGRDMAFRATAMETSRSVPERMASVSVSVYDGVFTALERLNTERLTLDAYLAVLIHRNRTGKWPARMDEAGIPAEKNLDFVTGSPLGYRTSGKEMRIWHSGQNSIDDGGISREEARMKGPGSSNFDAVYQFPWPKGANP